MPKEDIFIINSIEDLRNPINEIIKQLHNPLATSGVVIFLNGDLATGKTEFVRQFANMVGIDKPIKSPTFSLMKSYNVNSATVPELHKMIHIDAYRLEPHHKEILNVEKLSHEIGTVIFVEWPTSIQLDISLAFININFEILKENIRKLTLHYKNPTL